MDNAQELIAEFHNSHPDLNSHIKRALEHVTNHYPPSTLPQLLTSTHMSDASTLAELPSESRKIRIHSPFLHTQLPQMRPLLNYAYRTPRHPALSVSETKTSHIPTSPPLVTSTTQTKKTYSPPYQKFHVDIPPFERHSEGPKQPSLSQTTPLLTKQSSPLSPECATPSTMVTHTSARLKRSSASLVPSDTEGRPVKMTKLRHSSHNCTRFDNWNMDLSRLPLRHQHPLTSLFQHLPFRETRKSRRVPRPPVPESAQWPVDRLRPSNLVPKVPGV